MTQILIVTTNPAASEGVVNFLRSRGFGVSSANGFHAAVEALNQHAPEFLISDVRLGAFNALHLAIRHRDDHPGMQTIVLDCAHDVDIEREAARQGALYLVEPIDANQLFKQIAERLAESGPPRRFPRKTPAAALAATAGGHQARVIDVSYCGLRLEVVEGVTLPDAFDVTVADPGVTIRAHSVWARNVTRGWTLCGAEVVDDDPQRVAAWRQFVDAIDQPSAP